MSFLVISDVHAAFDALARVAREAAETDQPLLVLGDLVNLIDYRTTEGIIPDVVGRSTVRRLASLRQRGLHEEARSVWIEAVSRLDIDVEASIRSKVIDQYRQMAPALEGARAFVTFGNADDPALLRDHLPPSSTFIDGGIVEIDGLRIGIAGGGIARIGAPGEVDDGTMKEKLSRIGPVDVLCTHVPPATPMLAEDAVAGTDDKGSMPVLEYLDEHRPAFHYHGDVHQPRAVSMLRGPTTCRNVGYFRATGRAWRHRIESHAGGSTSGGR